MPLLAEKTGPNMIVRFTRPERRNSLSIEVLNQLNAVIDSIKANSDVKTLIFTGTGDVFASGADLREIDALTSETAAVFAIRGQNLMTRVEDLSQETIAAINGYCFGGALDLALACKRRIAGPDAVFSHPGVGLGIITGWGGTQRLPRLIGQARAMEILFTAKRVSAAEALKLGLIDEIAPDPIERALRS